MRPSMFRMFAVILILATTAWASSETILYNFNSVSGGADGYYPFVGVTADADGNLYGTTDGGGKGYGVVYELSLSGGVWSETVLHTFTAGTSDGAYPAGALAADKSGNLYGITYEGGAANLGTIYELKKSGSSWDYSMIYSFAGYPKDGAYPLSAGLLFDSKGNMYGTTEYGGADNLGTIFLLKSANGKWSDKILHSFTGGSDGKYPVAGLIAGKGGYFYGTTEYGGPTYNAGTVFELFATRGLWIERPIYDFPSGGNGSYPLSPVAMDKSGNLYGTTYQGGSSNVGVVYRLTEGKNHKWSQSVLHSFAGGVNDGEYPYYGDGVVLDSKGDVYGVTYDGASADNYGSVYELALSKGKYKESILHGFTGGSTDGCHPRAGLLLLKGDLYGTAYDCGLHTGGVVFELVP